MAAEISSSGKPEARRRLAQRFRNARATLVFDVLSGLIRGSVSSEGGRCLLRAGFAVPHR